jgi:uncharacterized protein (TIGR03086 family)
MLDALTRTFDHTTTVVGKVGSDQLDAPTPCREWTVRDLLAHMTGVVMNMGRGASGEALLPDVNAVELDPDLAAQFRTEADRTLSAWTARGLDGDLDIGAGPMPATAGIGINLLDTATHTWDLARATGQDAALPDDLAVFVFGVARGIVSPEVRGFAGFDAEVPVAAGASETDKLAGFLGRRP